MDTTALIDILQRYGHERELAAGEVLIRQGTVSDGIYYLKEGRLGVHWVEQDLSFLLSVIEPGQTVGEVGATTGWVRTATVKAEVPCRVIYVPEADFRRALNEIPSLAAEIACQIGERLTNADAARVTLGRSYRQADARVQALCTEKARLEELLRLREELADMIIHDLRNPLGVLTGGLEFLRDLGPGEGPPDDRAAAIQVMERAARRMRGLVDTLLDIARLEAGELQLRLAPLDLGALVEEALLEQAPLAEAFGIAHENALPGDLPPVLGDRDVVQRVLINLLDNAIKYTPSGGTVRVEAHSDAETVTLEVIDTGPGIPLDERERIFEKFTQVRRQAEERRGSGLGLAFCQMAVQAHGGRIWVEDGPDGTGSRFAFALPRA
jgi:signal transduction histidine kinase